jgi:hypothetical protein
MLGCYRSIVVDDIQMFFKGDNVAILCIYFNYKERIAQTITNVFASLLKQICQDRCTIPADVRSLHRKHCFRHTRPTLDEILEVLNSELAKYSKAFLVADALDECPEENGIRARMLTVLRSLAGNFNLMVTSRSLPIIAQDFQGTKCIEIRAKDEDIKKYITSRISFAPRHVKNLQEDIETKVIESARGM